MRNRAFGLIDLLVGMVILAAVCMMSASFMSTSSVNLGGGKSTKSVKEHVNTTVNEIEQMRQQSIDMQTRAIQQQFE